MKNVRCLPSPSLLVRDRHHVFKFYERQPSLWAELGNKDINSIADGIKGSFSHGRDRSSNSSSLRDRQSRGNLEAQGRSSVSERGSMADLSRPSTSTSRDEVSPAPWAIVMGTIAELRGDIDNLKCQNQQKSSCKLSGGNTAACAGVDPISEFVSTASTDSDASFCGFKSAESEAECEEEEIHDASIGSVLMQSAQTFGPTEYISENIEKQVANMVNHLFDNGMRDDDYKDILTDDITKRPSNCHAFAPVECNVQIFEALKTEARKSDFRLKEVNKDIIKAATIIIKSLPELDS
ncbi:hypothetical protein Pcinc_001419 [Petrolisthes cinctipes]|uniref:Uncharacterized protein n=2 Tax=Petrolisthes cinctipes TaxID=88211 RepID=A0AAE1L3B0_PETCI|nr:hypothetical protein Pcinc_001419 [Petrolisthes cinctipes]